MDEVVDGMARGTEARSLIMMFSFVDMIGVIVSYCNKDVVDLSKTCNFQFSVLPSILYSRKLSREKAFMKFAIFQPSAKVFSLESFPLYKYLRHVGPTSLQYKIPFDVGKRYPQNLDVARSSAYTMPSYHALNTFAWGEHCS